MLGYHKVKSCLCVGKRVGSTAAQCRSAELLTSYERLAGNHGGNVTCQAEVVVPCAL